MKCKVLCNKNVLLRLDVWTLARNVLFSTWHLYSHLIFNVHDTSKYILAMDFAKQKCSNFHYKYSTQAKEYECYWKVSTCTSNRCILLKAKNPKVLFPVFMNSVIYIHYQLPAWVTSSVFDKWVMHLGRLGRYLSSTFF